MEDEVVLSGLSGRFPESGSVQEFADQLFAGVDLVTADSRRWPAGIHGLPERNGKLKDLSHFDATFFGVHAKQAHLMDPQLRLLLELTHEAVVDAGLSPAELRGSRTGVFVGVSNSETEEMWTTDVDKINGYALTGCCRAMFPNRISYTFDLKGPSYAIDTACSSSMFALSQAVAAMRAGHCDAAVVAGTNLCLKPANSLNFHRLSMLSPEGRCAAFDAAGRGYVRSEAAVVVLLQRRGAARRVYATVRGARCNTDGQKDQGITFPNGAMQRALAQETFDEAKLRPQDVAYVEAHGTGTKVGDPQEVNAIADLFCKDRKKPLLLGSVKSNMGHSEPASGLCSIAKVVVAMEKGVIPGNLHYKEPNPDIPALSDGRIQVVDKNTPWEGGLAAVNSFGFGGANAHIILESQRGARPAPAQYAVPRLVVASGRTDDAVRALLRQAEQHAADAELHALLDAVHALPVAGHARRGFALVGTDVAEVAEAGEARPVWFVFSGMGSQWPGMAKTLMALPVFAASIARSAAALKPHGLDLVHVITEAPDTAFDNVINSFVSIAAVQVALVDVLREIGIRPDGIVGHSVGEVGCAYADETLTGEQAVLCAYWRGRSIVDAKLAPGAMAAVGLSWADATARCPPELAPACHNAPDSVTVSGSVPQLEKFVEKLTAEGIFARRVNSSGVAFHSKYIASAAPLLKKSLEKVIPNPKPRTARWISSSIPKEQWGSKVAQLSSAEYHVNNLVSPVRFAEALREVPEKAIIVEVSPHALMAAVLRRAIPTAALVPLIRRDAANPLHHLLSALGRLYVAGAQPQPGRLYPKVSFPVSRGTPALASSVLWDHSQEWSVADFSSAQRSGENVIEYDLSKQDDAFIAGHNIDGRILFPATGYLYLVWKTMAKLHNKKIEETPIVLENVQFKRATIVSKDAPVRFLINILEGSGDFEVMEGGAVAVSGSVRLAERPEEERLSLPEPKVQQDKELLPLNTEDVYKELRLRGYNYGGIFRGIRSSDARGVVGSLAWDNNWISFMDTMLQFGIIGVDTRELYLPTRLQRAFIDPAALLAAVGAGEEGSELRVSMHRDVDVISAAGVELRGVKTSLAPRRANPQPPPKLERYCWVPNDNATPTTEDADDAKRDALTVTLQLALENLPTLNLKVLELAQGRPIDALLLPHVMKILDQEPQVRVDPILAAGPNAANYKELQDLSVKVSNKETDSECTLVCVHGLNQASAAASALTEGGLVLVEEVRSCSSSTAGVALRQAGLALLAAQAAQRTTYLLARRPVTLPNEHVIIEVDDSSYNWVEELREAMSRAETEPLRVYVVARQADTGVLGLGTCLRGEPGGRQLRVYHVPGAEPFSPAAPRYRPQVALDLASNVLHAGVWGTRRHLLLAEREPQLQVEHAYVNTLTRGDLSSLRWIESELRWADELPAPPHTELCRVHYAPLNFRDIMLATGKLPPDALPGALAGQECILGLEFSGVDSQGRRVMGMVAARGLASTVQADRGFLWAVPAAWSLEEAATVPVAYATAYYALAVRGGMRRGEALLVHAGSGGVGQAAIAIALHHGCTVFTTVGTPDKRAFLRQRFPNLPDENIGNSRDTSFEQLVMRRTGGRGVDLVLNSLAQDKLMASVRCLANGGRFLEIGKLDLSNDTKLGMSIFLKNTTFHGILLDALFEAGGDNEEKQAVMKCVTEGIASGAVRPLPATVFSEQQLEQAFRFMATGKHIGKVLVKVRDEAKPEKNKLISAMPRTYMHPLKSYVLVGGLGGFGLELAGWLVKRGARNIVLSSRGGVREGYQAWCVRRWRERGVTVLVRTDDVTTAAGAKALLTAAAALGPVGGVFNLAAVLRDAFLDKQTPADFRAVAKPKIDATLALDAASRTLAPDLDYFVVFSSVSCGRGNPGQSNYGLANSAMERIVERRQAEGLPGLAVQWGAVGEVGLVAAGWGGGEDVTVGGTVPQRMASCLDALGALLARPHATAASMVLADKRRSNKGASDQDLVVQVANILGIKDPTSVSQTASLAELGMDSLMGAEIKQTLERGHDVVLGVAEIRALTFGRLKELAGAGEEGGEEVVGNGTEKEDVAAEDDEHDQMIQEELVRELVPTTSIVELASLATDKSGERCVLMVHPIEGVCWALRGLAARVRGAVLGAQCRRGAPLTDMASLARHYVAELRQRQPRPPYTLLGYSYGASVAVEMALQLQKEVGADGVRVVLVDGSPQYVATHTRRGRKRPAAAAGRTDAGRTDAADEADGLCYFAALLRRDLDLHALSSELESLPSFDARVSLISERLCGGDAARRAALGEAARLFYRRLVIGDGYQPKGPLKASVQLFTARDNYVSLDKDYGLSALCAGPLSTTELPATHRSILRGACADTIAKTLSELLAKQ